MEWTERFDGRVAIITGGAAGLGLATARAFAACGAAVVLVDIDAARLESAASELGADSVRADLTKEDEVVAMVRQVVDRHGRIDILVNFAGIYPLAPIAEETLAGFRRLLEINLDSTFLCCKHVIEHMRTRGYGRIVNISSGTFKLGVPGFPAYVASKAGVLGLSRVLAKDVGEDGITVNVMMPGLIATDTALSLFGDGDPENEVFADAIAHQAVKRSGHPDDIAHGILFLCDERSSWMTGQTLNIDGGWNFT